MIDGLHRFQLRYTTLVLLSMIIITLFILRHRLACLADAFVDMKRTPNAHDSKAIFSAYYKLLTIIDDVNIHTQVALFTRFGSSPNAHLI